MADRMAQRMGSNASTIEASFGMPGLANDIQTLDDAAVFSIVGLYDVVIYIDDSGSMEYYNQHDGRKDDLMSLLEIICKIVTIYDEDGVSLRFFNSTVSKDNVRTAQDIISTIRQVQFDGLTPLGTNLDKRIIQPLIIGPARAGRLPKPVLTIVLTDGEPNGEEGGNNRKVFDVIGACRKALAATQYGVGAAEFQFVQLGKDLAAQKFLGQLDSDPVIGDLVDVTSNYEMEAEEWRQKGNDLDVGVYIHKLLTGSIDPNMDAADE
ncbi:hypothetical protein DFJ74DRAFT_454588 [Hyaloraphidium curvatum]|nr:hypothetical protein DFJ74DRAFT_454588 [Hyaloraphidium curvatum]